VPLQVRKSNRQAVKCATLKDPHLPRLKASAASTSPIESISKARMHDLAGNLMSEVSEATNLLLFGAESRGAKHTLASSLGL